MGKNVAVVIKDMERQYEGLRSSLGLLVWQHKVSIFVLDHEVALSEEYEDAMGLVEEMGGGLYSNVDANVDKHGFKPITLEDLPGRLLQSEVIIPF
jgi:hypothetical protein